MKPFLYSVAEAFYQAHGSNLQNIAFIFPNRRAGIFFQKYLAEVAGAPLFSPPIYTVNDFYQTLVSYQSVDRISLLFMLYENYIALSQSSETFDNFLFWGEMLLGDFDDIDKYVVDAKQLFTNIEDIKEIEDRFEYMSEEQIAAIRRFWNHFIPAFGSPKKMEFVSLWQLLYPLYESLRSELQAKGLAYEGMIFREVAEKALNKEEIPLPHKQVVFVGLNVLSRSEKVVMKRLRDLGVADFYWDYQAPTFNDPYNKAAHFMKENTLLFTSRLVLDLEEPTEEPTMELIGVPSAVGQAKQVHTLLADMVQQGAIPHPHKAMNTAIVLPDEQLLLPLLYSIPESINPINVTMGYTLANTSIAGLMTSLFDLQKNLRMVKGEAQFYHRKVLSLLSHRYVVLSGADEVKSLSEEIHRLNKIFIPTHELHRTELLSKLFLPLSTAEEAAAYLLSLLETLANGFSKEKEEEEENENHTATMNSVEKEFLYHYYLTVQRLQEVIGNFNVAMNVRTFFKLLEKMTASITIPFHGEPLSGLQVMGVLETRALDFENLVILSLNEGIFPVKKVANTFIPYNLRKGFGLSTTDHQDSIYAYYFYRMIYRAKRIYMLYDTRADGMKSGEVSRYIYQLRYHYRKTINEKSLAYNIAVGEPTPLSVIKDEAVMQSLRTFCKGGERAISASALNTYLNCPMQFYLQYVEGLRPEDEVTETIEASTFGSIFHEVMEQIYLPFKGAIVTADLLKKVSQNQKLLTSYIEASFAHYYFKSQKPRPLTGQNYLVGEVLCKYVKKTLEMDSAHTPFHYLESERRLEIDFEVNSTLTVRLKAFIDRVDQKQDCVRIVDYKTGEGKDKFSSIDQLFTPQLASRPKAIMQVFMYAMMYRQAEQPLAITPSIYYLHTLFRGGFQWGVKYEESRGKGALVENYLDFDAEFREAFAALLSELFDPNTPFAQCDDVKGCTYCPFTTICKR